MEQQQENQFKTDKVITVSFGHMAHDTFSAFLGPMLPVLIEKLGFSLSLAGLLDVIRRIPSIFTPLIGLIADNISLKFLVILTPSITAICMCLLGIAPSYAIVAILLFVSGISAALFHVPSPVLIKTLSGSKTATGMSFYMFGGEIARALGPLLITAALSEWGLAGSLKLIPLGLAASLILFIKLRNVAKAHLVKKGKKAEKASSTIKKLTPFFTKIGGFLMFRAGLKSSLTVFLPTYLIAKGESLWLAGAALSALQFAGAIGTFATGYISDRIGRKNTLVISAIFTPLTMLFLLYSSKFLLPVLVIHGLFLFAPGPLFLTLVQETGTDRPAFVNSVYMTISFSISSIMVLVAGFAGDWAGLENTYKFFTWFAFLAIPCAMLLENDKQVSPKE